MNHHGRCAASQAWDIPNVPCSCPPGWPRREQIRDIRLHKPEPRIVRRDKKLKAIEAERVSVKKEVFTLHHWHCRVCFGVAYELHELLFRSLGGKRSLKNSIPVCNFKGKNCHRLLQSHVIKYSFVEPRRGALGPIDFERDGRVIRSLPGQKPVRIAQTFARD